MVKIGIVEAVGSDGWSILTAVDPVGTTLVDNLCPVTIATTKDL